MVIFVWRGGSLLRRLSPARRRRHDLRRRQAVDVEVPASRGTARDQPAARARGAADAAGDDLRRRDPQPLHSRLPHPHGPAAGPLHVGLVPGHAAGNVSPVLFPVLRHQPRGHDGSGDRHGAGRLRPLAAPGGRGIDGPGRAQGVPQVPLRSVATAPTRRPVRRCWRTFSAGRSHSTTAAWSRPTRTTSAR